MSKGIYTSDELYNSIDKEIGWRKKELKLFKDKIPTEKSELQIVMLRSSIPIIYAHWEGFVKTACEYYWEYVSNRRIILKKLKPQFIATSLKNAIKAQEIRSVTDRTQAIQYILDHLELEADLPTKNIINTKSNLNYSVFSDICNLLCIEEKDFILKKEVIDSLVQCRNNIAHGNYLLVTYKDFLNFYNDTIGLLEQLRTSLQNATALDNHMRVNA